MPGSKRPFQYDRVFVVSGDVALVGRPLPGNDTNMYFDNVVLVADVDHKTRTLELSTALDSEKVVHISKGAINFMVGMDDERTF